MDKSCHPSAADSTTSNNTSITTSSSSANTTRDQYLRHLNKLSQKINKPIANKKPTTFEAQNPNLSLGNNNPVQAQQNLQHQPPVYNINKNDFRDVVQKLTGSPAHERISAPPPINQPKPASTRLQRIRPPPLPQITNRPPPLLNPPPRSQTLPPVNSNAAAAAAFNNFSVFSRPSAPGPALAPAPLSPLPPFPTVHAPAESPISAYMRDLQNLVDANTKQFAGFSTLPQPPQNQVQVQPQTQVQQEQQQQGQGSSQVSFPMPTSPVPFGCLNSQLASYPLLSPGLLFSPTSGQLGFPQLPLSPTVPVPSPRWRGI